MTSPGSETTVDVAGTRTGSTRPRRKRSNRVASLMRWLHIYLSMFGLFVLLFFSVTGITLNHPDLFYGGIERTTDHQGKLDPGWVKGTEATADTGEPADPTAGLARLEIVEYLRAHHAIHGGLAGFSVDDQECVVDFKGPGYSAVGYIQRASGEYTLTETYHGVVAVINDLHKGRDTGPIWSVVIDASAVLMTVASLTGLVLLFYIKRRRVSGVVTGLVGAGVIAALIYFGVP